MAASDVLVLGCASAGKTSLVRGLMQTESGVTASYVAHVDTASTTGVEVDYVQGLSLREVGSPLRSMWLTYLPAARAIMYVVDASSPLFLAEACVDLLELVADDFNVVSNAATSEKHLLLEHCKETLPQLTCATTSARTADGLQAVHAWLRTLPRRA